MTIYVRHLSQAGDGLSQRWARAIVLGAILAVGACTTPPPKPPTIPPHTPTPRRLLPKPAVHPPQTTAPTPSAQEPPATPAAPELAAPELAAPELAAPEQAAPELAAPELATPEQPAPEPALAAPLAAHLPTTLVGMSQADVRALLGDPATAGQAGPAHTWTYRADTCSLTVRFFYDVTRTGFFALSEAAVPPPEQDCLARVRAQRHGP